MLNCNLFIHEPDGIILSNCLIPPPPEIDSGRTTCSLIQSPIDERQLRQNLLTITKINNDVCSSLRKDNSAPKPRLPPSVPKTEVSSESFQQVVLVLEAHARVSDITFLLHVLSGLGRSGRKLETGHCDRLTLIRFGRRKAGIVWGAFGG